jgi:hypothetical protein
MNVVEVEMEGSRKLPTRLPYTAQPCARPAALRYSGLGRPLSLDSFNIRNVSGQ